MGMGDVIDFDFNNATRQTEAHGSSSWREETEDLSILKARLQSQILNVCSYLFPEGKLRGHEFLIGDLCGSPGKSLSININDGAKAGIWADFATGEKGDVLDLWTRARNQTLPEAIKEIQEFLGAGHTPADVPRYKPEPRATNITDRIPVASYYYKDASGNIVIKVNRYLTDDGKKTFLPFDVVNQRFGVPPKPPLYNLPGILDARDVIYVEGEKCADALISLGYPATTNISGSNAPLQKMDWSPLAGKNVLIWPDNDKPGAKLAEEVSSILKGIGATVRLVEIPEGKPKGWDVADALEEGMDVRSIIQGIVTQAPAYKFVVESWDSRYKYEGEAPRMEWLVEGVFPMNAVSLLAAAGGTGKGMLCMDLAIKIACRHESSFLDPHPKAFGENVLQHGNVVLFSAEDDYAELHRRLEALDPGRRRKETEHRMYLVPLPSAGGPKPIVVPGKNGPELTEFFYEIRDQLVKKIRPKLVIFDPLSHFSLIDVAASRAESAFLMNTLASLANDIGAAVLAPHHLNKIKTDRPIMTPEQARAAISGSAGIVDTARLAYALWPMEEVQGKHICKQLCLDYHREKVFCGCVVKSNCPSSRAIRTFVRDERTGLLYVVDEILMRKNLEYTSDDQRDILLDTVRRGALAGRPFTVTGANSMHERREELPEEIRDMGRGKLAGYLRSLIEEGMIKKCVAGGSKKPQWLDVENGPFATGIGEFEQGFVNIHDAT